MISLPRPSPRRAAGLAAAAFLAAAAYAQAPKAAPQMFDPPAPFIPTNLFAVPDDMEVTLWAKTPDFRNPSNMDIDSAGRVWLVETPAERPYTRATFADGDCLLFGGESKGLPPAVRAKYAETLVGIPMPAGKVRSLNLATAVGVVLYEALRQLHDW